ncbi:MAG: OmpA family protein [Deltaproteobacteria bacterium]|nr:OmpA family protein [Deltaproteobacteria bacterium]
MFLSGTDSLNKEGIETLKTLSEVLEKYPDRNICIEGHTDNVPIGPKDYRI